MTSGPDDNIFVKILRGEIPSYEVYSNEHVYAFLDILPQAPGHSLVIPRSYSPNALEAPLPDLQHCLEAVKHLAPAIKMATGAGGISVITNAGKEAGQMVEYLHFHIIPRNSGDKVSLHEVGPAMEQSQLSEMAGKIKECLG